MSSGSLNAELSKKCGALKLWVLIGICVGAFIVLILGILSIWILFQRKSRRTMDNNNNKPSHSQIPNVSKDIRVDRVGDQTDPENVYNNDKSCDKNAEKMIVPSSERAYSSQSREEGSSGKARNQSSVSYGIAMPSPLIGLPEVSQLGWGHWFTLRDLEIATNRFAVDHVIGEGGYGVVYSGRLVNGTDVAVKKLLNNLGQAEKEFRVEVEAIGHVRHKNLVRLLGYCIEGVHRMLVYEYVSNGNLEQWLHGAMRQYGTLTWEARMKVLLGTAKA
ncbi:probable receptor-like protein kinase at2g42960 [Phtheirospermum japonicum]|uniref:non-specific serine/threonine protein kinase n=1 Tax=Phtheirospermum japonicum TaxID=374723 RepID=A0A830D503_9LAMI|nr:probable receptor-like protein kinase at2g42960 [Phtheirospermum japonicum]